MGEIPEGKKKDTVWIARELATRPNWAVVKLLMDGKPRTNRQIYAALGKQFTRKTLIRSIRVLSLEIKALAPQHLTGGTGFEVGYSLAPDVVGIARELEEFQKAVKKRL